MAIHKVEGTLEESKRGFAEIINKPRHRQEIIELVTRLHAKNEALRKALEDAPLFTRFSEKSYLKWWRGPRTAALGENPKAQERTG